MQQSLRTRRLPARTTPRRNVTVAIVAVILALGGVSGCGSSQPRGSGVLAGEMTWASPTGSAILRVFSSAGRLEINQGVSSKNPRFRFVLKSGQYQILIKLTRGYLGPKDRPTSGCPRLDAEIRNHHTTHVILGRKCSVS